MHLIPPDHFLPSGEFAIWSDEATVLVSSGRPIVQELQDEIARLRAGIRSIFHESNEEHVQCIAKRLLGNKG